MVLVESQCWLRESPLGAAFLEARDACYRVALRDCGQVRVARRASLEAVTTCCRVRSRMEVREERDNVAQASIFAHIAAQGKPDCYETSYSFIHLPDTQDSGFLSVVCRVAQHL